MMTSADKWIQAGYSSFAQAGLQGLKVEAMARQAGISKSSFYHHFADVELFTERLMQYHLQQVTLLAGRERLVQRIDPELIDVLLQHETDLFFSRQLRFAQEHPLLAHTLQRSNELVGTDFIRIWKANMQLQLTEVQLLALFGLAIENFFLQLQPGRFNRLWLQQYFNQLQQVAAAFA
ncbi:MAG: TetR/AcrR family transcriptional regulator [Chitinophagaceae bacterium]|nr:TetR/AcrR family transcriptional regulator [Chitinophagaceae bacterium]